MNNKHQHLRDALACSDNGKVNDHVQISDNLTEVLVQEEMERQLTALSSKVAPCLKRADIMSYALNRLPALYAATKRGRQKQAEYAHKNLQSQIESVVRQAIAAVMNDPLRTANESWQLPEQSEAEKALAELGDLLQHDVNWETLTVTVKHRLAQAARGEFYLDSAELMDWEQYPLHQHSCS